MACKQTPTNCLVQESGPSAFARHLMPGVALQSYYIGCSALDPKYGPTEIWLLRAGHNPDELTQLAKDESATYKFAVPAALLEHAAERVRRAVSDYSSRPLPPLKQGGQYTVPTGSQSALQTDEQQLSGER